MKIAFIFSTLAKTGGTERMITEKANYFAEQFGYDVTIINLFQRVEDTNHYVLSKIVKQINLGIPYFSQYKYKYPKRLWIKWRLNKHVKKSITQYVKLVDPDILIGISFFKANLVCAVKCRAKKIIESHETKTFTYSNFIRKRAFLSKIYQYFERFFYFRTIERNADAIITLSEGDKMLWKRTNFIDVIPNFSTMHIKEYSNYTTKRVIAVGRIEWEKGFERLIEVWKMVESKHSDWQLDIFGDGKQKTKLNYKIKKENVKKIAIHSVTYDISKEYANSSICAVTSHFEGFSLVLLEAMKHGLACIAFDCPFGPKGIINDNKNGFLIDNGNIKLYAERLSKLIEDEELRKQFSNAAIDTAKAFDVDIIMNKWKALFEQMLGGRS